MKKILFIFVLIIVMFIMVAGCAPSKVIQVNTPVPKAMAGTPAPNGQINVPGVSIQVYAPGPNPMVNTPDGHCHPRVRSLRGSAVNALSDLRRW